jgi:hypothetical protein
VSRLAKGRVHFTYMESPEWAEWTEKLRLEDIKPARVRMRMPKRKAQDWIGERLQIYWDGDKRWYYARVLRHNGDTGKHEVIYDDGVEAWETLGSNKTRVVTGLGRMVALRCCPSTAHQIH